MFLTSPFNLSLLGLPNVICELVIFVLLTVFSAFAIKKIACCVNLFVEKLNIF